MSIPEYLILFSSVLVGGGLGWVIPKNQARILNLLLSFSGAFILGITALHILPAIFEKALPYTGLWLLAGFFVQLLLEQFSHGVEHGHIHTHNNAKSGFAIQILLGLSLHALIEGIPLNNYTHLHEHVSFNHLLFGIVLHKIPAAFALSSLLLASGFTRRFTGIALLIFATMSPAGAWISTWIGNTPNLLNYSMALVAGSFVHIATTILFETDETKSHKIPVEKFLVIIFGVLMAVLTM